MTFGILNLCDLGLTVESNGKHVLITLAIGRSCLEFELAFGLIVGDEILVSLPVKVECLVGHGLLSIVLLDPPLLEHIPFLGNMVLLTLALDLPSVLLPVEHCHSL